MREPIIRCKAQQGFSLIEAAVALLIIGLLIGGVFVGNELITQATIRKVQTQIDQYITAHNTFEMEYGAQPGDISNASDFWPGLSNGNGDNLLSEPSQEVLL